MRKLTTIDILCLVLAAMMLLAVIPFPYGYYVLVRFVAMVVFGYLAFSFFSDQKMEHAIIAGVLALLFQPFVKVALGREVWQVVDVLVGILLVLYVFIRKKEDVRCDSTSSISKGSVPSIKDSSIHYDVFISYATRDYMYDDGRIIPGNVISQIQKTLRDNGISYWIDKEGLLCGDEFPVTIAEQIRNAKVFLFVSSQNANQSDWTLNEIATARNYGKRIIPFRYDNTPYDTSIMIYVAGLQYVSFQDDPDKAMSDLVTAIHRAMGKDDLPADHIKTISWEKRFTNWIKKFWWTIALLMGFVGGGIGWGVSLLSQHNDTHVLMEAEPQPSQQEADPVIPLQEQESTPSPVKFKHPDSRQVYVTPKGHRYHTNRNCRYIRGRHVSEMSEDKASELRLLPCLECSRRETIIESQ